MDYKTFYVKILHYLQKLLASMKKMEFKYSMNIEGPDRNTFILGIERIKERSQSLNSNRVPPHHPSNAGQPCYRCTELNLSFTDI
jgi:hypothetical protein